MELWLFFLCLCLWSLGKGSNKWQSDPTGQKAERYQRVAPLPSLIFQWFYGRISISQSVSPFDCVHGYYVQLCYTFCNPRGEEAVTREVMFSHWCINCASPLLMHNNHYVVNPGGLGGSFIARIAVSNPAEDMDVRLVCLMCVAKLAASVTGWSLV
jgi:hypothetical protein